MHRFDERHPHFPTEVRAELSDVSLWTGRGVLIAYAAMAGLTVVVFTWLSEHALAQFFTYQKAYPLETVVWTTFSTAAIVWITRRFVPGIAGSGIPQVLAALQTESSSHQSLFVSLKLSISKLVLTAWGLMAGLSIGREGPSVQVAAGVLLQAKRWLKARNRVSDHALLTAGGAAGIAAAFNTPLGGIVFAIEELGQLKRQNTSTPIVVAIVVAGLMGVSAFGNANYFGVIRVDNLSVGVIWPATCLAVCCGLAGGLFSRLLIASLSNQSPDWVSRWRVRSPIWFAAACGLAIGILGLVSNGETYGSGYAHNRAMLENVNDTSPLYVVLKYIATWISTWAGVPAGVFAPSLAIGGAMGNDIAQWSAFPHPSTLIALGMAGFLAAVTQAPLTAFIIVMEMIDGHGLVLGLMSMAIVSSGVARLVSAPLYTTLAKYQLMRIGGATASHMPHVESPIPTEGTLEAQAKR